MIIIPRDAQLGECRDNKGSLHVSKDNKRSLIISRDAGFSLTAGGRLKNRLLRLLSRLLFQEIEDGETGTRLPSRLL